MIKAQIIGHLGKDAEMKTLQSGKTVINFSVAHAEKYNGETKTVWVECAYWTDKTGIMPYLKKGSQVYVEGNPDIRIWESNTGKSGASLVMRVQSVQLLGGGQQQATQQQQPAMQTQNAEPDSDLPF